MKHTGTLASVLIVIALAMSVGRGSVLSTNQLVTPEGTLIEVDSTGPWTADDVYRMLRENGLDSTVGATLTVKVQDVYPSQTAVSAQYVGGVYSNFRATMYLKGIASTFANTPDSVVGHEYGHAWTLYHLYMHRQVDWSSYLTFRGLTSDPRLETSYAWSKTEMIADDYRLVMGSALARSQQPSYINPELVAPSALPGFADFFRSVWASADAPAPTVAPATPVPTVQPTIAPSPIVTVAPTAAPTATPSPTAAAPAPTATAAPTTAAAPTTLLLSTSASPELFRKSVKVSFTLAMRASVSALVLDSSGQRVRSLGSLSYKSGTSSLSWDGKNDGGQRVGAGDYVVVLVATAAGATGRAEVMVTAR